MSRRTLPVIPAAPAVLGAAALLAAPARAATPAMDPDRVLARAWCDQAAFLGGEALTRPLIPALSQAGLQGLLQLPGIDPDGPLDVLVRADGAARLALRHKPGALDALVEGLRAEGWGGEPPRLRKAGATYEESVELGADGTFVYERRYAGSGGGKIDATEAEVGGLRARGGCGVFADTSGMSGFSGDGFDAVIAWFARDLRSAELRFRRAQAIEAPPVTPPVVVESPGQPIAVITLGAEPAALFDALGRLPLPKKARDSITEARRKLGDDALPGAGAIIRMGKGPLGGMEMIGAIPTGVGGKRGSRWRSRRMLNAAVRGLSDELLREGGVAPTRIDRSTWRVTLSQRKEAVTLRVADGLLLFSTSVDSMLGVGGPGGAPWLSAEGQAWAAAHHVAFIGAIPAALFGEPEGAPVSLRIGAVAEAEHAVLRVESSVPFDELWRAGTSLYGGDLKGKMPAPPML